MNENPCSLIDALLDGELGTAQQRLLTEHLKGCDRCRARLAEGQALRRLLSTTGNPTMLTPTPAFWAALAPRLHSRRPGLGLGWLWGGAMVGGVAIAQAVSLAALSARVAVLAGVPVGRWLSGLYGSASVPGEKMRLSLLELLPMAPWPAGWNRVLSDGTAALFVFNLIVVLVMMVVALAFMGWVLATRRRLVCATVSV